METQSKNLILDYKILGMVIILDDISLELMKETISSLTVYDVIKCSKEVKEYYGLKI